MEENLVMKNRRLNFVAFIGLLGLVAALVTSAPAAQAPFYEGKTLRVLIASGPGGGTDTAGRLVARYLPKYLLGNPKIVIQNMGGGGGTIANNYFASEVKPDGLTVMQDSSSSVASFARGGPAIKYDPRISRHRRGRPAGKSADDPKRSPRQIDEQSRQASRGR
jgi:hypothetical protein